MNAGYDGGEFTTRPLVFEGSHLELNISTSAAGSVWVELQTAEGKPIDGYQLEACDEIVGDEIARTITWKDSADVSRLAGKPVKIRCKMKDADIYAIRFR
jgi:hypothetical protein